MSKPLVEVLIATYEERISCVKSVVAQQHANLRYRVVHQTPSGNQYAEEVSQLITGRDDINYHRLQSRGVTKSRNWALKHAEGDIIVFMDDDVLLEKNFYEVIVKAFQAMPQADLLTFSIKETGTDALLKPYPASSIRHHKGSILKVGTIEVAGRLSRLREAAQAFPEYLGAGTSLSACDEPVYLSRLMKAGLRLFSYPQVIACHPRLSSGKVFENESQFVCRGVAFREIFGMWLAPFAIVYFYLKNRSKFSWAEGSPLSAFFKGYFLYSTLKK